MRFRPHALIAACLLSAPFVTAGSVTTVSAASGSWTFCQSSTEEKCIEQVIVTKTDGSATTYTTASALTTDRVLADIGCSAMGGDCDGVVTSAQAAEAAKTCAPIPTDMNMRSMTVSGGVIGHRDWTVRIDARTGTFEPAFSLGNGIVDTRITADGDGTWKYSITMKPVVQTLVTYPADLQFVGPMPTDWKQREKTFLATAEASKSFAKAGASIWPPSYLLWTGSPTTGCAFLPMNGMWGTTNGTGFEFGLRKKESTGSALSYEFVFKVSAAHYIRKDMLDTEVLSNGTYNSGPFTGEQMVNPADIRMMLPKTYITSLGYAQVSEIPSSALVVTAEDGQSTSPKLAAQPDGSAVLDFGISHFSAPNPTLSIQPKSTTTSTATASSTGISLARSKSLSLSRVISTSVKGTKTWTTSGKCRVSGSRVVASASKGTCRVTLTVRSPKKKVLFRKTVTVTVS